MSKAFTKESDGDSDELGDAVEEAAEAKVPGLKNYITPSGLQRLREELRFLLAREDDRRYEGPVRRLTHSRLCDPAPAPWHGDCEHSSNFQPESARTSRRNAPFVFDTNTHVHSNSPDVD